LEDPNWRRKRIPERGQRAPKIIKKEVYKIPPQKIPRVKNAGNLKKTPTTPI